MLAHGFRTTQKGVFLSYQTERAHSAYAGGMRPKIIDEDTGHELWTASECADYSGTARGTFTSYATRGRAPKPVTKLHGLTLWDSTVVREWVAERSGSSN